MIILWTLCLTLGIADARSDADSAGDPTRVSLIVERFVLLLNPHGSEKFSLQAPLARQIWVESRKYYDFERNRMGAIAKKRNRQIRNAESGLVEAADEMTRLFGLLIETGVFSEIGMVTRDVIRRVIAVLVTSDAQQALRTYYWETLTFPGQVILSIGVLGCSSLLLAAEIPQWSTLGYVISGAGPIVAASVFAYRWAVLRAAKRSILQ